MDLFHQSNTVPETHGMRLRVRIVVATILVVLCCGCGDRSLRKDMALTARKGRYILFNIKELPLTSSSIESGWPSYGLVETNMNFRNTTDYFFENISLHPSYFAAPGLPKSSSLDNFESRNNAWCIVCDAEYLPGTMPVLFTRNLQINSLDTLNGSIRDNLSEEPPFGKRALVYITRDGTAHMLSGDQLYRELSSLFIDSPGDKAHRILRP